MCARRIASLCFVLLPLFGWAQYGSFSERPKLVVQVVVGQLSADEVLKAKNEFDGAGIRTLVSEGTFCSQAAYSHPYVRAASSLATLVTGANPAMHGITGDLVYNRKEKRLETPYSTQVPALWDELQRISPASKVISVAYTRQASVLLGGNAPSCAYWFDETSQLFVCQKKGSATAILSREALPTWAQKMNEKGFVEVYKAKEWQSHYPKIRYSNVSEKAELIPFTEGRMRLGKSGAKKGAALLFRETPFVDNLVKDFAIAAIQGEGLGQDVYTDVLTIYWDAPRQIGNLYGLDAPETQDAFFRMDDNLGALIQYLKETVGRNHFLLCLTSDAGGPGADARMIEEVYRTYEPIKAHLLLNAYLGAQFGPGDWVLAVHDQQVFLDREKIEKAGLSLSVVQEKAAALLLQMEGVFAAYTAGSIPFLSPNLPFAGLLGQAYLPAGGDVYFMLRAGWKNAASLNRIHSGYLAQRQVPLFFYGWRMKPQTLSLPVDMTDVVSTLSNLMDLPMPSGAQGRSIEKILE